MYHVHGIYFQTTLLLSRTLWEDSLGTVPARFPPSRSSHMFRWSRHPQLAILGEATLLSLHNDALVQKRQECRFPDS